MMEEKLRPIPSKGWAEMIRKVFEVDPMVRPQCGRMKVIAFLTMVGGDHNGENATASFRTHGDPSLFTALS
jgi:hypothetical protein